MLPKYYEPESLDRVLPRLPEQVKEVNLKTDEGEPPVQLDEAGKEIWEGKWPAFKEDGAIDTSETLYKIGCVLADAGLRRVRSPALLRSGTRRLATTSTPTAATSGST